MYEGKKTRWLKHLDFIVLDILCMEAALLTGVLIRHGFSQFGSVPIYGIIAWVLLLINIFVVFFDESYKGILRRGYFQEFKATFLHVTYVVGISVLFLYLMRMALSYSRMVFLLMWGFYLVYSYIVRIIRKCQLKLRGKQNRGRRRLLVITGKQIAEEVISNIKENNYGDLQLVGAAILDADLRGQSISGFPVVADQEDILSYLKENWVDEVFISLPEREKIQDKLLEGCAEMGLTIHLKLAKMTSMGMNQVVDKLANYTVLTSSVKVSTPRQIFLKRLMDICGGLAGLLLTAIATIFVAPAIYLSSPGPIFFSQIRIGKNGKKFKIYKFRSMYMDAEERKKELMEQNNVKDGMMFKMDNDPRIIKGIGHFIRKTSIDELPQFWNVLKGDMSLIGTRPPTVDEWEKYDLHHRKRMAIKPGITGMWQVSGRSNIKDFEEVVKLDTEYILNWSIGLDLRILAKTVKVVLMGEGAE